MLGWVLAAALNASAAAGFQEERRLAGIERIYAWPAADRLLIGNSKGTQLVDLTTAKPVWSSEHKGLFAAADAAAKFVVLADKRDGVFLLNGQNGQLIRQIQPPKKYRNALKGLAVAPAGHVFAVGTGDSSVHLHRLPDGLAFRTITTAGTQLRVAFAPNNALLAVPDTFSSISLFDTRSWQRVGQLKWDGRIGGYASRIVFSPDSRRLAALIRGRIWLWDVPSRRVARTLPAKFMGGGWTAFSPDGKWLAASGMWELQQGSPSLLAAVGIWDAATAAPWTFLTDAEVGGYTGGLPFAFSPDGQRIAVAFPTLNPGPAAVIWRQGAAAAPNADRPRDEGFKLTVTTVTARSRASSSGDIRLALRINGEAARQVALKRPGRFRRGARNTFADLVFEYPLEQVKQVQMVVLGGTDAWELRNVTFQFTRGEQRSQSYVFPVSQWFSMEPTDPRRKAVRDLAWTFSPPPIETLRQRH